MKLQSGIIITIAISLLLGNHLAQAQEAKITNPKFKYDGSKLLFVGQIQNVSNKRLQGSICARLFDKDGFEINHITGLEDINLGPGASQAAHEFIYLKPNLAAQIKEIKVVYANIGCNGSNNKFWSNVETVPFKK